MKKEFILRIVSGSFFVLAEIFAFQFGNEFLGLFFGWLSFFPCAVIAVSLFRKKGEMISIIGMSMLVAVLLNTMISDWHTVLNFPNEVEELGLGYLILRNFFLSAGIIFVMILAIDLLYKQKLTKFTWIIFVCFAMAALMQLIWTSGTMDHFEEYYYNTYRKDYKYDYGYNIEKRALIWEMLSYFMLIAGMVVNLWWWKAKHQITQYTRSKETQEYFKRLDPTYDDQEKDTEQHTEEKKNRNISNISSELRDLKSLKDDGVISEEEYEKIKSGILND